ncbi:MAG: hypothetical protein ACK4M6_13040 [Hyphomonas sp.]
MRAMMIPALAGFLLAGGCALSVADAPPQSAQFETINTSAMFGVTAAQPTALFSRSGHTMASEADNRPMPLFQVCSLPESRVAADIWLFPDQGNSDRHPTVKHVSVAPGACVFASGGYIEARLAGAAAQTASGPSDRIEPLKAAITTGQGPELQAWLAVTPIGR